MAQKRDISEAQETYSGFVALIKWSTIVSLIGVALIVLIIS
ncbi:MAG: cytochrome C oxidase subunit IV [Sphingobium sp. 66-54]|nr:MAG: cytochrome C oxidase subunit IV [Sphingobium sp. 66-54]